MDNFLGRIRSGAGKATFEADKLRRVTSVQSAIKSLNKEAEKAYYQIGQVAYRVYGDGRITHPELKTVCDRLADLQAKISAHEQEIVAIRAEEFLETQASVNPQYGRICPNGHGAISPQDNFCQTCGAKAIYMPPPAPVGMNVCPNCNASLAADARFCAGCGQPTPEPAPVPESAATSSVCAACGAALLPGAVFCAECGHRAPSDEAATPETIEPQTEMLDGEMTVSEEAAVVDDDVEETGAAEETDELEPDWLNVSALETAVGEPPAVGNEETSASEPIGPEISACPVCHAPLLSDAIFCAECGHQIEAEEL